MRLESTFFRARDLAASPRGDPSVLRGTEAGADGDSWVADIEGGGPDVNPLLTGRAKHEVYDEMSKSDPTVKSLLWMLELPVRSASWGLNPKTEDPLDVLIRDAVAWNFGLEGELGHLDLSWDELNQQGLKMLRYGAMFEEIVPGKLVEWRDKDGDPHPLIPIDRVAPRYPMSVQKVKRSGSQIAELTQTIPGTRPIPGDRLSYLVFERDGASWDGVSVLRPAWFAWRLKKALGVTAGVAYDRFALGLPVVWHPDNEAGRREAKEIGRTVRAHEKGYVHLPVPPGGTRADAEWGLEILNAAQTIADPVALLRFCCEQIAEAGLQQFSRQGLGQTGARATSETQVDPYFLGVQAIANYLVRERSRKLFRPFVQRNFGLEAAERRMPVLTVSKIQVRSLETVSRALSLVSSLGWSFADREIQNDWRDIAGMPELPEAADALGLTVEKLTAVMRRIGVDAPTYAAIVAALPEEIGLAPNGKPEGYGLALAP